MLNFLKRRLHDNKGAMDTILVSLLLVIVGIGIVATFSSWMTEQTTALKNDANCTIQQIIDE